MKTLRTALTCGIAFLGLLISDSSRAADMTADEIVTKANEVAYYAGQDGKAQVEMTIKDAGGGTRTRKFAILRLNVENGNQKFYVYFEEPADVRRMAYLVWKNTGEADDDRWLWLPALNLKKRIAPGDKRTSFVGSDFLYEDVSGRDLSEDIHELVKTTDTHYVIKNTPKDPKSVEFAYFTVEIDKGTFLPVKAEYVDEAGTVYRRVEARKIETIQGHPTVVESTASDLKADTSTTNVFTDVSYDIGLKETIFTERFLRRPPREIR